MTATAVIRPWELTFNFNMSKLMRKHGVTIRELSKRSGLTQKLIRNIRSHSRLPYCTICDMHQAITGENIFLKSRWLIIDREQTLRREDYERFQDYRNSRR